MNTNWCFSKGRLTFTMDGGAGSSGKGKLGAFITEHADNWQFACHAHMSNAAHTTVLEDGKKYLYQCLSSMAYLHNKYQKIYICGGAVIEVPATLKEIKENEVPPEKLGIHPLTAVVQQIDMDYERGLCDLDGNYFKERQVCENLKLGSTLHGVGAARARRILRKKNTLYAKDVPELKPYICDTRAEIVQRLSEGQAGLCEIAQGFQLSYLEPRFAPKTTSRNCTVAAALDDCGIPPLYAGHVFINFRTFPIRVNSNKFIDSRNGKILNHEDMAQMKTKGDDGYIETIKGDSGACYEDQQETTWDQVTKDSGIKDIDAAAEIREVTSLTRLERRCYTWSKINLKEAIIYNRTPGKTFISINFLNYVDATLTGKRGEAKVLGAHPKISRWLQDNVVPVLRGTGATLKFLGTGAKTDDMISL